MEKIDIDITVEQSKALKILERAFKKCKDANVYFHNCYGMLEAYNGDIVEKVDDDEDKFQCGNGYPVKTGYKSDLVSWADDRHYVHFKLKLE